MHGYLNYYIERARFSPPARELQTAYLHQNCRVFLQVKNGAVRESGVFLGLHSDAVRCCYRMCRATVSQAWPEYWQWTSCPVVHIRLHRPCHSGQCCRPAEPLYNGLLCALEQFICCCCLVFVGQFVIVVSCGQAIHFGFCNGSCAIEEG